MSKVILFLTNGFEETEALVTADILRRGGVEVTIASITGDVQVTGSHQILVTADALFENCLDCEYDMLVLPGGPGTAHYNENPLLLDYIQNQAKEKYVAAICAAPSVLGKLGLLENRNAVCYPGFEPELLGACVSSEPVVVDGRLITAKGPGASMLFAFMLLRILEGDAVADQVKDGFITV